MSKPATASFHEEMRTLTPRLVCAGTADAIGFYRRAFDAVELSLPPGPQGKPMRAMLRIGDSALMLVNETPEWNVLGPKSLMAHPSRSNSKWRMSPPLSRRRFAQERRSRGLWGRCRRAIRMFTWRIRSVTSGPW